VSNSLGDQFLDIAKARTGLANFGAGESFLQDFMRFAAALDFDGVPAARRERCREYLLNLLMNRLWFEKDLTDNPDILEETLQPPVAIVSLPRAGTTKLQRILGELDHFQNLLYWQTHNFARIPGQPAGGRTIRRNKAIDFLAWLEREEPNFLQTHPMVADEVEEEFLLMESSFRSLMLASAFPVLDYSIWLSAADLSPTYRYLVKQLKYIQWQYKHEVRRGKPWLLKSPGMLGYEDLLTQAFPQGVKLICPHRNPAEVMPSTARTAQYTQFFKHPVESKALGEPMLAWFGHGLQRYLDWRKRNTAVEILDLSFEEITHDSAGTARKVCDFLGAELTDDIVRRIQDWDARNPRNKYGKNDATLEEYGFDRDRMAATFRAYSSEFERYF
jgi:Sulfotransferase family